MWIVDSSRSGDGGAVGVAVRPLPCGCARSAHSGRRSQGRGAGSATGAASGRGSADTGGAGTTAAGSTSCASPSMTTGWRTDCGGRGTCGNGGGARSAARGVAGRSGVPPRGGTCAVARARSAVACSIRARAPIVRPGSRTSPRLSWATNQAGRYASIGRPGFTASHHSRFGHNAARSWNGSVRYVPPCSARHAYSASGEVNASTWVRPSVVQVPQPTGSRPDSASVDTGSSISTRPRMRKYSSCSCACRASRIAVSASVAGSHSVTRPPPFDPAAPTLRTDPIHAAHLTYKPGGR